MSERKTLSSRDFNHDPSSAKKAADSGPVFISNRGKSEYVLMNIKEYNSLFGAEESIIDLIGMKEAGDIDFEPEKIKNFFKPENFS